MMDNFVIKKRKNQSESIVELLEKQLFIKTTCQNLEATIADMNKKLKELEDPIIKKDTKTQTDSSGKVNLSCISELI